jgi:Flp pilus assembly protein TadG
VTAEAAVVIPLLLAVTLGMVWAVALAVTQVRVVDAAREVARAAARGDSDEVASAHGRQVAPPDARIDVWRAGDQVTARVVVDVRGPGGLFGFLPPVPVSAEAVAVEEPQ